VNADPSAPSRAITILIAPDSFKGSLTSVEVARALGAGWTRARPADTVLNAPLGDGGEGTIYAVAYAGGWQRIETSASDPIGRQMNAMWLRSDDGSRAFIELAEASGLSKLDQDERARFVMSASTTGTGELIRKAIDAGARRIIVGIGGSATTDGGQGLIRVLGARWEGSDGKVDLKHLDPRLKDVDLEVACDVSNPLLGDHGAAAIYGPQKGATPAQVGELDQRNAGWADRLEAASGRRERETPGAGAAGGVGFALLAIQDRFKAFALRPGIDLVMEATDFDAKLARADLVITGEGRIDAQTAFGKTALGVARRAQASGVRCIAVGGGVEPAGVDALAAVGATAVPVSDPPLPVAEAMAAGSAPVERCGERLARAWSAGGAMA
jgi:glycerate 2-kinase